MANMEQYNKEKQELIETRRKKAGIDSVNVEEVRTFEGPKTRKEKFDNFWYHYKLVVFAVLFVVVIVLVWLINLLNKPVYDATFLIISEKSFSGSESLIQSPLKSFAKDVNGDGEIKIDVQSFQLAVKADSEMTPQMQEMTYAKVIGRISDRKDFVFMLDEDGYEDLKSIGFEFEDISSFTGSDTPQGDKYYLKGTKLSEKMELYGVVNNMFLCFVDFDSYSDSLKNSEEMQKQHQNQWNYFKALIDYE